MFEASSRWCALVVLAASVTLMATGQQPSAGDAPTDPGALAKDLSPELRSKAIRPIARKVADWQMARLGVAPAPHSWEWGTLDMGLMAGYHLLGDHKLADYVFEQGKAANWHIDHTLTPANDYAFAQALIDATDGNQRLLSAIRLRLDGDLQEKYDPDHPVWSSASALFFEAPAAVQLSNLTSDPTYDEFVNREWHRTEKLLYDPAERLFSADPAAVKLHEKNGKKLFEARTNGMVMASLVRILTALPSDDPLRPAYVERLRAMAAAVAAAQGKDGLWRPGLLDGESYPRPAVAGSSLIVYALAWGITHRQLDARSYLPVVERGWIGLTAHIYADGRLGSIEPVDHATDNYPASSSWNYGVGAFLLAASEVDALSGHKHW